MNAVFRHLLKRGTDPRPCSVEPSDELRRGGQFFQGAGLR